jgi:hypothetical protein
MAGREEPLTGKVAVRELVAEEHADDRRDRERAQDPCLFGRAEAEARQVAEDEGIPRSPNEELQHHHYEEFEADGFAHGSWNQLGRL